MAEEEAKKAIKRFDSCVEFILKAEGGYVNDKYDAGGETKYGISKRSYPDVNIKNLTLDDAKAIYKRDYWDACGCGDLKEPLDVIVFDTAVNMGVGRAKEFYQKVQMALYESESNAVIAYLELRDKKYNSIVASYPLQKRFLKGWHNRMNHLREFSGLVEKSY